MGLLLFTVLSEAHIGSTGIGLWSKAGRQMSIIKNWEPIPNSEQWLKVFADSEGEDCAIPSGRLFQLRRPLTPDELGPIEDLEQAIVCDIDYGVRTLSVDQPLARIIHLYLNTLK
jgi:hypothetical protein